MLVCVALSCGILLPTQFKKKSSQSCLGKLFMKVIAHRLGGMFARHPIQPGSARLYRQVHR
jgi:hypothetical protein